jgi:hypothetical protein
VITAFVAWFIRRFVVAFAGELCRQRREGRADVHPHSFGLTNVAERGGEGGVPCALHHAHGLGACERFPRDARPAQVVERDVLGFVAVGEQVCALDARETKVIT